RSPRRQARRRAGAGLLHARQHRGSARRGRKTKGDSEITMPDQLKVRLVTPDRILVDQTADAVEVPGKRGYFEVLYGHAPLLSEIGAGEVRLHGGDGGDQCYVVARGFVEVLPERVTILAETAEKPEEIDTGAAQ